MSFGDECGVFTASYGPLSNIGGTYFIQMYEYGVALKTKGQPIASRRKENTV